MFDGSFSWSVVATEMSQNMRYCMWFSSLPGREERKPPPSLLQSKVGLWIRLAVIWHSHILAHTYTQILHFLLWHLYPFQCFIVFPQEWERFWNFWLVTSGTSRHLPVEPFGLRAPCFPWQALDTFPNSLSLLSASSLAYHMHVLFICFFVLNKIWPHCVGATPEKKNKIHPLRENGYCGSLEKFT